ncbi:MAG TPA: 4'-phosphopantetheinyl transferase superfamily protein [Caulobacterales bacterium]|nr:4'-phosphopantetheinyl transferase superfamily protein [Caulobacterales bacterium]
MRTRSAAAFPLYAVAFQPAPQPGARLPRAVQSGAAEKLLQDLRRASGVEAGAWSKSHARTCAAAALAPRGGVGIDVEFRAPGRRIVEIAQVLAGAPVANDAAGYRLFTFREAYFKAFGRFPAPPLLRDVAGRRERIFQTGAFDVLHEAIAPDFMLTLVWTGGGDPRRLR